MKRRTRAKVRASYEIQDSMLAKATAFAGENIVVTTMDEQSDDRGG